MRRLLATTALAAASAGFLGILSGSAFAAAPRPIVTAEFDGPGSQNVVQYLGQDANLYQLALGAGGWGWQQATGAPGGPLVAPNTDIDVHVNTIYGNNETHYLTSVGGLLHVEQLYGPTFSAQDLTVLGAGQAAATGSNLAGFVDPTSGFDNVFYLGSDQLVHLLDWAPAPGWHEDTTLDGTTITAAATDSPISGHLAGNNATNSSDEIFYLGANQHVFEVWRWSQNFDGWHPIDVTTANGAKPVAAADSTLAGFFDPVADTNTVVYLGKNQHVYQLLFTTQAVWTSVDLTAASGSPNAARGSALAAHYNAASQSEEIFFLDSTHAVRELWAWSSPQKFDGWHPNDLTAITGGMPAAANSRLSTDNDTLANSDDVFYVAKDQNVQQLTFNETTAIWSAVDVNKQTVPVAPRAVP